jgi:hypothetical protein
VKNLKLFAMGLTKFRGTVLASHGKLHARAMLMSISSVPKYLLLLVFILILIIYFIKKITL